MKKILVLIVCMVLITSAQAQDVDVTLGNNNGTTNFTIRNSDSVEWLRVTDEGYVGIGTTSPTEPLEVNGAVKATRFDGFGMVPIGSIIPWHKSFTGTPSLPDGWIECNGQTISDPASPYNGQIIADLNGGGRFLRGGATSGTLQDDAVESHNHNMTNIATTADGTHSHTSSVGGSHDHSGSTGNTSSHTHGNKTVNGIGLESAASVKTSTSQNHSISSDGDHSHTIGTEADHTHTVSGATDNTGDTETRPISMTIVWIMRIK